MKKTLIYLLAAMVTLSLIPSCDDEDELAPEEVVNPDDGGGEEENPDEPENPDEETPDENEQGDAPVQITLINSSSSTLTVEWTVNGSKDEALEMDFNVELYKDEACSDLLVSWEITKDLFLYTSSSGTASNHKWVRFTFADGLEAGTDYWIKITALDNSSITSVAYKATTKPFDYVAVTGTGTATAGSVLVAEDFSGFIHGGDMAFNAIALQVASANRTEYKHSTGVNPTDYAYPIAFGTEFNPFTASSDAYMLGTGLSDWCIGNGTNTSTRSGYAKIGGGSGALGYLATPVLAAIPTGYAAKVKVSWDVLSYNEDTDKGDYGHKMMVCAIDNVEVSNYQVSGWTTSSDSSVPVDSQVIDIESSIGGDNADHPFYSFDTTLEGVTSTCRIRFSSNPPDYNGGSRFLLDNIVITVEELTEIDTEPLEVPTNLKAEFDEETLNITATWDAVDGATSYNVAYNVEGQSETTVSVSDQSYSFKVGSYGVNYEVKVQAATDKKVSEWSDAVKVEVPESARPNVLTVSNLREGLGWLNVTIDAGENDYELTVYDGETVMTGAAVEFIKDNNDGTSEFSISGLQLNTTYSTLSIVGTKDGKSTEPAELATFVTGNIKQLTRTTSPCHLYIEWDDVAANKNWVHPSSSDSKALDRTFWIQLATDSNFTESSLVYDLATVSSSSAGTYVSGNWNGSTGDGTKTGSSPHLYAFTTASMGKLSPSTTYYFRVRNAADETYQGASLAAANGKSAWSPAVALTTAAAHVAASGELLFQGFDDSCWQYDHINNTSGIIPEASATLWDVNGEHTYFLEDLGTGKRMDEIATVTDSDAQFPYTDNGLLNDGTNNCTELRLMVDDVIPSMNGWYVSKAVYPLQGSLRINSNSAQNTALVPPPFNDIEANTTVVVSCDAGTAYVAATKSSSIKFVVFDGTTFEVKSQSDVFTHTNDTPIETGTDPISGTAVFRPFVQLTHHEWETTIDPGDYVVFWGISDGSTTDRMIIDNLSVVKK